MTTTGLLDLTFDANIATVDDNTTVNDMDVQSDGSIVIGGYFNTV